MKLAAARVRVSAEKRSSAHERAVQAAVVDRRAPRPAGDAALDLRLVLGFAVPPDRRPLRSLSVFEGGFTMESAGAVGPLGYEDAPWTVDAVQSLRQVLRKAGGAKGASTCW